jgi:molybdopterin-guanine dinucleotide biosynthesis protein A
MDWRAPGGVAGFVLSGGLSSRMGSDKALLPYAGATLIEYVARQVERAAGSVVLVGRPEAYRALPYRALADLAPEQGPLGGVVTALHSSTAAWNLIVACDMPAISSEILDAIVAAAVRRPEAAAVVPVTPDGRPQPLCAAYHLRCREPFARMLAGGVRKMREALAGLNLVALPVPSADPFLNLNTPEDWSAIHGQRDLSPLHRVPPRR